MAGGGQPKGGEVSFVNQSWTLVTQTDTHPMAGSTFTLPGIKQLQLPSSRRYQDHHWTFRSILALLELNDLFPLVSSGSVTEDHFNTHSIPGRHQVSGWRAEIMLPDLHGLHPTGESFSRAHVLPSACHRLHGGQHSILQSWESQRDIDVPASWETTAWRYTGLQRDGHTQETESLEVISRCQQLPDVTGAAWCH